MPSPFVSPQTLVKFASDDREFAVGIPYAGELATGSGITISSAAVSGGSGLTFGSASVLSAAFDDIPSGKGVKFRISGGTGSVAGTVYNFAVAITLSNSRVISVPCRMVVYSDYGTS